MNAGGIQNGEKWEILSQKGGKNGEKGKVFGGETQLPLGKGNFSVCARVRGERKVLPTHQPLDHRGIMGTVHPEAEAQSL